MAAEATTITVAIEAVMQKWVGGKKKKPRRKKKKYFKIGSKVNLNIYGSKIKRTVHN